MNLCAATFDVCSISVDGPVIRGCVCLTVEYVDGHEQPPRTYVLFKCTTRESDSQVIIIDGTVQCTQLPPHTSYDIIATDYDASDDINTTAAVTILGVAVPDYTITPSSITPTNTPTGTCSHTSYNTVTSYYVSELTTSPVPAAPLLSLVVAVVVSVVFGKTYCSWYMYLYT